MSSPESTSPVAVPILRSSKGSSTVHFRTAGGTATAAPAGTPACDAANHPEWDYLPADMLVTFNNQATQQGFVTVCDNSVNEASETVIVQLYDPSAGTSLVVGKQQETLTITDNDPAATVAVANAPAGDEGTNQDFVVSLTGSTALPVSATVSTAAFAPAFGKAVSGSDYTATTTAFSWAPGDNTTRTFTVPLLNDPIDEPAETYKAVLTSVINASGQGSFGTGTITDTDAAPTVSIADNSQAEGNSGESGQSFTVSVSGPTASNIHVTWSTSAVGGGATAYNVGDSKNDCANNGSDGTDYESAAGGFLDFTASASTPASQNVVVQVCGDTSVEGDEIYYVGLDSVSYASIDDGLAVGTIQNDDIADADGDGVADADDNCVNAANPGQEDIDGGGAGEACDNESQLQGTSVGTENGNDSTFAGTITNTATPFGPLGHPDGSYAGTFTGGGGDASAFCTGAGENQGGFFIDGTVTLTYGANTVTLDLDGANSYFCLTTDNGSPAANAYNAHWEGTIVSGTGAWSAASSTNPIVYDGTTSGQNGSGIRTDSGSWAGLITI
jgi:hypothetical protein